MMDPISSLTAGINSSIRILEVTYQLRSVGEETTDLLRTTQHVDRNISEARRLRGTKNDALDEKERRWMDSVIHDTRDALLDVAQLIEPARVDTQLKDTVNAKHKLLWVLRDGPKVRDKHKRLSICHQSLMAVVNTLHAKDSTLLAEPSEEEVDEPPPYEADMEALFNWKCRRRGRASTSNVAIRGDTSSISSDPIPRRCRTSVDTHMSQETPSSASTLDSFGKLTLEPFTAFSPSLETLELSLQGKRPVSEDLRAVGGPDPFMAKSEFDDSPISLQQEFEGADLGIVMEGEEQGQEQDIAIGEARLRRGSRATRHWRREWLTFYAKTAERERKDRGNEGG